MVPPTKEMLDKAVQMASCPVAAKPSFDKILGLVDAEVRSASSKHPKLNSAHEAYAVILEELDEFKMEVWRRKKDKLAMRKELIQTAAMCVRALHDLDLTNEKLDMIGREVPFVDARELVKDGYILRPSLPALTSYGIPKVWRFVETRTFTEAEVNCSWVVVDYERVPSVAEMTAVFFNGPISPSARVPLYTARPDEPVIQEWRPPCRTWV